ncbi:hypothetical protein QUA71_15420 [Microcoleus sp. MON1_C5]|uniref:hypothetical protein n=1 Tax=Microcoleus sp. MON1_C5 TaxID=2818828 RepID=UPI002FD62936
MLDGIRQQIFLLKRFEGHKWSIAHIAFVVAEEILDQLEVIDGGFVRSIALTRVKLFNPCTQQSSQYFAASEDA